jgi:hypothetical protein
MTTISLLPGLDGIVTIEPLSMIFLILVQIGGRFLKIELTPAQQKIINNVIIQSIILFAIIGSLFKVPYLREKIKELIK